MRLFDSKAVIDNERDESNLIEINTENARKAAEKVANDMAKRKTKSDLSDEESVTTPCYSPTEVSGTESDDDDSGEDDILTGRDGIKMTTPAFNREFTRGSYNHGQAVASTIHGLAVAAKGNTIASRNVKKSNTSNATQPHKKPRPSPRNYNKSNGKAKVAPKASTGTVPTTRPSNVSVMTTAVTRHTATPGHPHQVMANSLSQTNIARLRNNNGGAISDGSSELVSHSEVALEERLLPMMQGSLIDANFALCITRKKFMRTMEKLSKQLPDDYSGERDSYPGSIMPGKPNK